MAHQTGSFKHLPQELDYLIEPAMTFGRFQFDDDVDDFLDRASDDDMEQLARVSEQMVLNKHRDSIDLFLDHYPITDHEESANLYFLLHLLDAAGFATEDEDWNTVERHIESLGKFGSPRLDAKRMWAARFLADFGDDAREAVPALHRATDDSIADVRVWAHYALAIITGDRSSHEESIRSLTNVAGSEALDAIEKLDEQAPQ